MMNILEKAGIAFAVIVCSMLLAGCRGGSSDLGGDGELALVSGQLSVTGAPLADLSDPAETGELDSDKWGLRVIDPTESVDSAVLEHGDTTFPVTAVEPLDIYLLRYDLLPAVDLSGGTAAVTPLEIDVAFPAIESVETTVTTEIELVAPAGASSLHATSQTEGYRIRVRYALGGPRNESALLEIDWNHRRLRRDMNGDGRLDDEAYFSDSDRNGISDNRQQGYMGNQGMGQDVQASGQIEHVDTELNRITIAGQVFLLDESTQITDSSGHPLAPGALEEGQVAAASGRRGRFGNVYAVSIEVNSVN
jgi:hypothetical protein